MSDDEDFILDDDLVELVIAEAQESLDGAVKLLQDGGGTVDDVGALFRCFHSIKGNCAMAQRTDVSQTAHKVEDYLDRVRTANRGLSIGEQSALLQVTDLLGDGLLTKNAAALERIVDLVGELHESCAAAQGAPKKPNAAPHQEAPIEAPPPSLLGRDAPVSSGLLHGTTEPQMPRQDGQRGPEKDDKRLKVDAETVLATMKVAGELFQLDERLKHFVTMSMGGAEATQADTEHRDGLMQIAREFDSAIEKLYDLLLDIQRLPVSQIASPLERALRDICRSTGKEIQLVVEGRDLRLDKQVLQVLRDPLMHMVRNSADHGVEMPDRRQSSGKPRQATIRLQVEELDDVVAVTIADDGAGIALERVKKRAIERGLVSEREAEVLTTSQIVDFIFQPGFSTAEQVSDLSGRGVGMDVVMKQLANAGGSVHTSTTPGVGTTFRLEVPKAGSPVMDGLAVQSGNVVHLLPLKHVVSFVGRREFQLLRQPDGQVIARLGDGFHPVVQSPGAESGRRLESPRTIGVVLQGRRGASLLLPVDDVIGRRKALVQSMDALTRGREERAEVCILGDGTMAFSLSVDALLGDSNLVWHAESEAELGTELEAQHAEAS